MRRRSQEGIFFSVFISFLLVVALFSRTESIKGKTEMNVRQISKVERHMEIGSLSSTIAGSQQRVSIWFQTIADLFAICDPRSSTIIWKPALSWLIFPAVSGVEMKDFQRSEQAHFLISRLRSSSPSNAPLCSNASLLQAKELWVVCGLHTKS